MGHDGLARVKREIEEAARKAQRDADPFLAKQHELRQAIPQMEDMLKLLRRYQRTGGSVLHCNNMHLLKYLPMSQRLRRRLLVIWGWQG